MRYVPRLGAVNAAIISLYFSSVWGIDALRALLSPYYGFEHKAQAVAAGYYRALFDFHLDGLARVAYALSGIKFVIAVGFVAYLIDFTRAFVVDREPNRETLDTVLAAAVVTLMLWAWPALAAGDGGLIRLYATQFLLLTGAMIVIVVERHIAEPAADATVPADEREPSLAGLTAPTG
jgi:hypothetical protein